MEKSHNLVEVFERLESDEEAMQLLQRSKKLVLTDHVNGIGETVLHVACRKDWIETCSYIVKHSLLKPDHGDRAKVTPLHIACFEGHKKLIQLFAPLSVVHCENVYRKTPLDLACLNNKESAVQYLLAMSHDRYDVDSLLQTIQNARVLNNLQILKYLLDTLHSILSTDSAGHSEKRDSLLQDVSDVLIFDACTKGHIDTIEYLTQRGCCINIRDRLGNTPLHTAAGSGQAALVNYLMIELSCDPNDVNQNGDTALHCVYRDSSKLIAAIAEALINSGCNASKRNQQGDTALHLACMRKAIDTSTLRPLKDCFSLTNNGGSTPLHLALLHSHKTALFLTNHMWYDPPQGNSDGQTVLHLACRIGLVSVVEKIVKRTCCDVNCQDNDRNTPLHIACIENANETSRELIITSLLQHDRCNVNTLNSDGCTPLHTACMMKNYLAVKLLVESRKCDLNVKQMNGDTPLHIACRNMVGDIVHLLVCDRRCEINHYNCNGDTPLLIALHNESLLLIETLLIREDCNVSCRDLSGNSPLHLACHMQSLFSEAEFRRLLFNPQCKVNQANPKGNTPIHEACLTNSTSFLRLLLNHEAADTNVQNNAGETPLHIACSANSIHMTQMLVECPGDVNLTDTHGDTPLHVACRQDSAGCIRVLLTEKTCRVNIKNEDGNTPLHICCQLGHINSLNALFGNNHFKDTSAGAVIHKLDLLIRNHKQHSPFDLLLMSGHLWYEHMLLLEAVFPDFVHQGDTLLHAICRAGKVGLIKDYLHDVHSQNQEGLRPIQVAILSGHVKVAEALLTSCNLNGESVFHVACVSKAADTLRLLLQDTGKLKLLEHRDYSGATPLHVACSCYFTEGVRLILKAASDNKMKVTTLTTNTGETPLHVACTMNFHEAVSLLIQHDKHSIHYCNLKGENALHIACLHSSPRIVKCILSVADSDTVVACQNRAHLTPLHYAFNRGSLTQSPRDILQLLVEFVKQPSSFRLFEDTLTLHIACERAPTDILEVLLSKYAWDLQRKDHVERTPLHCVLYTENVDSTKLILRHLKSNGYDCFNSKDLSGNAPVHLAARMGNVDLLVNLVEEHKCDPFLKGQNGNNILHFAAKSGKLRIVELLVQQLHCNPATPNSDGNTPLHVACKMEHAEVVRYLLSTGLVDIHHRNFLNQTALDVAYASKDIRSIFSKFNQLHQLREWTTLDSHVKILALGDSGAGKSTLIKSIQQYNSTSTAGLGSTLRKPRMVPVPTFPTTGIEYCSLEKQELGKAIVLDFGGRPEYHLLHAAVLEHSLPSSASICLLVINLSRNPDAIASQVRYWLAFLKSTCREPSTMPMAVVGSFADMASSSKQAFAKKLDIVPEVFALYSDAFELAVYATFDCRRVYSPGLECLVGFLKSTMEGLQSEVSIFAHGLYDYLETVEKDLVVPLKTLSFKLNQCQEYNALFLPSDLHQLSVLLRLLSDRGFILFFRDKEKVEKRLVVVDIPQFLTLIQTKLCLLEEGVHEPPTGVVSMADFSAMFSSHDTEVISELIPMLHLGQKVNVLLDSLTLNDKETPLNGFIIPSLLTAKDPSNNAWPPEFECADDEVHYFGWALHCSQAHAELLPRLTQSLLVDLTMEFIFRQQHSMTACYIWREGIRWCTQLGASLLVQIISNKAIVVLSAATKNVILHCAEWRADVIRHILEVQAQFPSHPQLCESLIRTSSVSQLPDHFDKMIVYNLYDTTEALLLREESMMDTKSLTPVILHELLTFEPYMGLSAGQLAILFSLDEKNLPVELDFVREVAGCLKTLDLLPAEQIGRVILGLSASEIQQALLDLKERSPSNQRRALFEAWFAQKVRSSYKELRHCLDRFSIFTGRNVLVCCH